MADAKTGHKKNKVIKKPTCPKCGGVKEVVKFVALAASRYDTPPKRGYWWMCQTTTCGYAERTS